MTVTAQKAPFNGLQAASKLRKEGLSTFAVLRRQGEVVYLPTLPGLTNYLVFSPEVAYDVLVQHPDQYQKPDLAKRMLKTAFGNGIFFSEGDFWRRQRKLAQPAFHHRRINTYAERMVALAEHYIEQWKQDSTLDVDTEMHALTLVIVIDALFKTDVSAQTDEIGGAMRSLGEVIQRQLTSAIDSFMPDWVPTPLNRRKLQAVGTINRIIYRLIAERRASGEDNGDLLSMF